MGKFLKSGITWSDVTYLIEGLERIHECEVELRVRTATATGAHLLSFIVSATTVTLQGPGVRQIGSVTGVWPDQSHPTLDSCIFNACYDLDREIGRYYTQLELKKSE